MKIAAVSYINTLPFLYGIDNSAIKNSIEVETYIPSVCAEKLIDGSVDIGLVPVAILPKLNNYHIISDYCIGANNKVDSVFLLSDVPLNSIENIILDYHSQSSNNLTRVLSRNFWNISPKFINPHKNYQSEINGTTAGVIIGNRAFESKNKYKYAYDLAYEWKQFTGKSFVFALWVSNKEINEEFVQNFNLALELGIKNIDKLKNTTDYLSDKQFNLYLTQSINYTFDNEKRESLKLFLEYIRELDI